MNSAIFIFEDHVTSPRSQTKGACPVPIDFMLLQFLPFFLNRTKLNIEL